MKTPTLIALAAACILTGTLTSGALLASPQSDAKPASHAAETTDGQWIKHAADDSNAEIMMPAKPRLTERTFRPVADEPFIKVKTWLCTADDGQIVFTLSYHDLYKRPKTRKQEKLTLDGAVKGTIAQVVGNTVGPVDEVKVRTYRGRKFTYEFKIGDQALKSDAEVYLIGKRQYMISTIFKPSNYQPKLSQKLFESFNPFDPEDDLLAAGVVDTNVSDAQSDTKSDPESQGAIIDGLTLPLGEQPVELK